MASAAASRRLERASRRASGRQGTPRRTTAFGADDDDDDEEYEMQVRDGLRAAFQDLRNNPQMFRYGQLRDFASDRSFVLIAVHISSDILNFVPEHFRDDKEIMLIALGRKSSSVHVASAQLRGDREYALAAVSSPCRSALSALPDNLRADADIVAAAVATHGHGMLVHAAQGLRSDRDFLSSLSSADHREHLKWVDPELRADRDFVIASVRDGARIEYAHESLRGDKMIMLGALEDAIRFKDGRLFEDQLGQASKQLHADASFARDCLTLMGRTRLTTAAFEHYWLQLRHFVASLYIQLHPDVWMNEEVLLAAAALYAPDIFPLVGPIDRIHAAVSSSELLPMWIYPHEYFEHCLVQGEMAMIRGGEHMRAALRWRLAEQELHDHFPEDTGSHIHVGNVQYSLHAQFSDVTKALLLTDLDVKRATSLLESEIPPEELAAKEIAQRTKRSILCTGGVDVTFRILRSYDGPASNEPKATHNGPLVVPPEWGEELHSDALREVLRDGESIPKYCPVKNPNPRMKTFAQDTAGPDGVYSWIIIVAIPANLWERVGIDRLHAGHWIRVGEHFWSPMELGNWGDLRYYRFDMHLDHDFAEALAARRAERPFVLSLMSVCGMALQSVTADLRADREVVMAAVMQNGEALQCARSLPPYLPWCHVPPPRSRWKLVP